MAASGRLAVAMALMTILAMMRAAATAASAMGEAVGTRKADAKAEWGQRTPRARVHTGDTPGVRDGRPWSPRKHVLVRVARTQAPCLDRVETRERARGFARA